MPAKRPRLHISYHEWPFSPSSHPNFGCAHHTMAYTRGPLAPAAKPASPRNFTRIIFFLAERLPILVVALARAFSHL